MTFKYLSTRNGVYCAIGMAVPAGHGNVVTTELLPMRRPSLLKRNTRVMVATEQSNVRHILETKVKENPGFIIVGEAESAIKALSLARSLRPDVAIIDSALPHNFGIDSLPLSRIGGLDTAQAISEEMPNTRVILLTNTDTWTSPKKRVELDLETVLGGSGDTGEAMVADSVRPKARPASLSFTHAAAANAPADDAAKANLADSSVFLGSIIAFLGLIFVITMLLAPVGLVLLGVGLVVIGFGLVTGMFRSRDDEPDEEPTAGTRIDER
jgi:hypothetical protein